MFLAYGNVHLLPRFAKKKKGNAIILERRRCITWVWGAHEAKYFKDRRKSVIHQL